MSKFIITACGLALLAFTSCSGPSSPSTSTGMKPNANSHSNSTNNNGSIQIDQDIDFSMYNSCCDETIEITGKSHIVLDPDGSHFHLNFYNITGAGSNGNTYHGGASESSHDNNGNGAENSSFTESFVMTSSNGCQFHVKITEHVTFNADGTGTAVVDSFDSECM